MANAPIIGPGCAERSSGAVSRTRSGYRVSSRSGAPPLLSSQGRMSIRDGQVTDDVPLQSVFVAAIPFIGIFLLVIALLAVFPDIILFLPSLL